MISPVLRVAVVQMQSVDDLNTNLRTIKKTLLKLKPGQVDLVLLPENSLYLRIRKGDSEIGVQSLREAHWQELSQVAGRLKATILIGVSVGARSRGKKSYNAIVQITGGARPKVVYKKIHLFDVDVKGAPPSRESDMFEYGQRPAILRVRGFQIGLSICYDVRFSELYLRYAKKAVDAIVVPAAFLVPTGQAHWHTLLRARAIESQAYVLAAAQSGGHHSAHDQNQVRQTFGHTMAVDPWGAILAEQKRPGPGVLIVELNREKIAQVRAQIPMARHRRL